MYSDPHPEPYGRRPKTRTLWLLAAIGFIVFIWVQLLPTTDSESLQVQQSTQIITKEQARESAAKFAATALGYAGDLGEALVTYDTDSDVYGYLTREDLMADFLKKYDKQFPYDVFQVRFEHPDAETSALTVDVHMTTGKVVGFEKTGDYELSVSSSWEQILEQANPILSALGFDENTEMVVDEVPNGLLLTLSGYTVGEAQAEVGVTYDGGRVTMVESYFDIPQSYTDYIDRQTTIANWLTYVGYALMTFVLGILAIVYSALKRIHTSFKRGIILASVYFLISLGSAINMLPYFEKEGISGPILIFSMFIQGIVTLIMAASIYFSLVGGDGLWREQGIALWPRAKEQGYGRHVLSAVWDGYAWALILLGVQSVIFLVLENTIHMWSTTDDSQSTYNMLYPALLPLLAWVAGIGEEAVYRLFGIPMLKKMFRSTVAASVITTLIWAFGHTLYPIYPVISRPIELLFIGLLFSFIFLRYGFITVMFAHVIFDSLLMSISVMFTGGALNIAAGIFFIALPAIVAYVIYLFNPPGKERPPVPPQKKEEPLFTTPLPPGGHL
ncbi:CPBP family intramembrane glutamic endopeptidase [Paenibacillus sp. M1]|uniref:CPBP family intramembrane glutamic endopeptidase n=1 Tax=Paenibacillus haidiansis TaxID=1574488 RepID=A0ABU7VXP3_9BACL